MTIQQIEKSAAPLTQDNLMLLTVHASSLKGRGNISCYNAYSKARNIPIVFLLHGVYGNHWVWMNLGGVDAVYERLRAEHAIEEMLLVMPEDGSYYAGSAYLPLSNGYDFESWIVRDAKEAVVTAVDCVSERSPVYIAGLSMGGYGALRLGAKYADQFQGISAHSSITDLAEMRVFVDEDLSLYACDDANEPDILYWLKKNQQHLPPLRLDCGTDDVLWQGNQAFTQQLVASNIPHRFQSLPGGHEWSYWHRAVEQSLRFFHELTPR